VRQFRHIGDLTLHFIYKSGWTEVRILSSPQLIIAEKPQRVKIDLSFISRLRHLRIVRMDVSTFLEPAKLEWFKSQVKRALLDIQNYSPCPSVVHIRICSHGSYLVYSVDIRRVP